MRKSCFILFLCAILTVSGVGCFGKVNYEKYKSDFMGLFDTYTIIIGYAKSEAEFNKYSTLIHDRLVELDKKYDIYEEYEGLNNIATMNKNAGGAPVTVDKDIIDMLVASKNAYTDTDGIVNVTMGSVLSIWHDHRKEGLEDEENATVPSLEILQEAAKNTDINNLIIDEAKQTVFLKNKGMSLDVGATAKGFAANLVVEEAKKIGMNSALVNVGGNIVSVGKPLDDLRDRWGVGIQDPNLDINGVQNILDTVFLNDATVACSGDYERFYIVDGKVYNHIIDPHSLMPADRYKSVSIIHKNAGTADILSTALFILPIEDGKQLLKKLDAEALWIMKDDSTDASDGYKAVSKKFGNYSAVDKK